MNETNFAEKLAIFVITGFDIMEASMVAECTYT
jgi:hypothetical protein